MLLLVTVPGLRADDLIDPPRDTTEVTDEVTDDVTDEESIEEAMSPSLNETIDRMRRAGRRIGDASDTGEETRALQQRAVADLDQLLELAKRRQQERQPSNAPPDQPNEGNPDRENGMETEAPAGNPMAEPMDDPTGDEPGNRRKDEDEATESTDLTGRGADRDPVEEHRRLVKDVWGHLRPEEREQLLNAYTDKPLPKYSAVVKAYFRALAERSRREE